MKALRQIFGGHRPPLQQFPSPARQVVNFGQAMARAAGAAVSGRPVRVPAEVLAEREAICAGCEENLSGRCKRCGCGIQARGLGLLLRKTHLAGERCPLEPPKWVEFVVSR